jgi:lipopolysaccharide transport system permease protein
MFRDLLASRGLAWRLFVRDTRAQYRQSILGYVWAFIPPLVASFPFVFLNSQGVVNISDTPIPYPAYAMIGTIVWQVFVDALNSPLRSVNGARPMLARINFPREAILLAGAGQVVFGFLIRSVLLVLILLGFHIPPPMTALLFPVGIMALMITGFALGILLTPAGLLYSDIQQVIPIGASLLMYLTPVLYPTPRAGHAAVLARLNPLTPLVTTTRDWLTLGAVHDPVSFMVVSVSGACLLFVGWLLYRLALPHMISRFGN